jgi:phytoene synthase
MNLLGLAQAQGCTAAQQDLHDCVQLMRGGSKTFFAASRLLPPRMREASIALYAFCRVADDLVDEGEGGADNLGVLSARLDGIYAGRPEDHVEDRALAAVVSLYRLPRPLLDALLEGFAWDAQERRYESLQDVQDYGARVAGSVGAMMAWLMGARDAQTLARACELGVAMQLTNICRDVGTDARMGRLYLPRQWLREADVDPDAWLARPECTPALQSVVDRLLKEADRLYAQASMGIAQLPADCRPAIAAARLVYAEIGQQLRRDGLNPVQHRAVVPAWRKSGLLLRACLGAVGRVPTQVQPLEPIAYLVSHCTEAQPPQAVRRPVAQSLKPWGERAGWMLELFERQAQLRRQR